MIPVRKESQELRTQFSDKGPYGCSNFDCAFFRTKPPGLIGGFFSLASLLEAQLLSLTSCPPSSKLPYADRFYGPTERGALLVGKG